MISLDTHKCSDVSCSNFDVDSDVLGILQAMSKVPSSSKAWKGLVLDSFFDNRFFNMPPPASSRWSDILRSLLEHDRQVFQDILGKISSSPSGNIFANREYENITKSRHLRRLAYALYIGRKNDFLNQLPAIQEKLVEVLRVVTSPMVHSEVFCFITLPLYCSTLYEGLSLHTCSVMQTFSTQSFGDMACRHIRTSEPNLSRFLNSSQPAYRSASSNKFLQSQIPKSLKGPKICNSYFRLANL